MQTILSVNKISKAFGGLLAVNKVSLEINRGEIVGVIGPNGAGKTTLFNCITGFYHPDEGQILFRGKGINRLSSHEITKAGMVRSFQNGASFPSLTVAQHLEIAAETVLQGNPDSHYSATELMELLQLTPYKHTSLTELTHAIETRVQIAVLLALKPYLILLDEPAAGMNFSETVFLKEVLAEITRKGLTICLIEHNMRFVMDTCDRIIVLDLGSKLTEGEPEAIKNDEKVIKAYLGGGVSA